MGKLARFFVAFGELLYAAFLHGLLTLLPIALTVGLFVFTYKTITGWLRPVQKLLPPYLSSIPNIEVAIVIIGILLAGILFRMILMKSVLALFEGILERLPLVRPIYLGFKQLISAFTPTNQALFKKVVLVEFLREGAKSIGFMTSEVRNGAIETGSQKLVAVFIPTTPNPTSGFLILVPESAITVVDITRQEAMAMIISGGIIQPDSKETDQKIKSPK